MLINMSIRELLSRSVQVSIAESLMLQECRSYSSKACMVSTDIVMAIWVPT